MALINKSELPTWLSSDVYESTKFQLGIPKEFSIKWVEKKTGGSYWHRRGLDLRTGLQIYFTDHDYMTVHRRVMFDKSGDLDIDKVAAKVEELLALKQKSDEIRESKAKKEHESSNRKESLEKELDSYGHSIYSTQSHGDIRVKPSVDEHGVNLDIRHLTPLQADHVIQLLKELACES